MKKFTVYYPTIINDFFTKDVGIIPFIMEKYYGYKSKFITYDIKDELIDNKKYLNNMEITLIKDDDFLNNELLNTDVLMLFGIYQHNLDMIIRYKQINPNGKIYLKLEGNTFWIMNIHKAINEDILNLIKSCNLITLENRQLINPLYSLWQVPIFYIPNGYYDFTPSKSVDYKEKENIILMVGRIDDPIKGTSFLLEAFKDIDSQIPNWRLELVGSVSKEYIESLEGFFKQNPHLRDKIKICGRLNKEELKEKYRKAKVFCLPSISEGCANVFAESVSNGCYMIASDVDGAIDIIDYGRYGRLFPVADLERLKKTLLESCLNEDLLRENCEKSQIFASESLNWINLCGQINQFFS